ncbi:MAG: methylated-DNA--[protein]-cysteine S-methyltransferase [Rhizobiaceae bacterium]|nr:methylated-DNA--[protein]-cysteine S-methyltransferase [Rhizobiaceae bacterium]
MPVAVLDTALGSIGLAWSAGGLTRLSLPDRSRDATLRRLRSDGAAEEPLPKMLVATAQAIARYADGETEAFDAVPLDLSDVEDAFRLAIYAAARALGYGETTTYGELAARAGYPGMAREAGAALGTNPVPLIVPCHRILAAGGKIGGFSAPGGSSTKLRLLSLEGVSLGPRPSTQAAFAF